MRPEPTRVAYRFLLQASGAVAPSAEGAFWHNPERYEVRQMAETGAVTNDPEVAVDAGKEKDLSKREVRKDVAEARRAPPLPSDINADHPGSDQFSTLSRYLVETEQPTPSLPSGVADRPMHPDPEERKVASRSLSWKDPEEWEFQGEPPRGTEDVLWAENHEGLWHIGRVLRDGNYIVAHIPSEMDVPLSLVRGGWEYESALSQGVYPSVEAAQRAAAKAPPVEFDTRGWPQVFR